MINALKRSGIVGAFFTSMLVTGLGAYAWEASSKKVSKPVSQEYIKERVAEEILTQLDSSQKHENARLQRSTAYVPRGAEETQGSIYLLPHWPTYSLFFDQNDLISINFDFKHADRAFKSKGGDQNLAKLIFGEQKLTVSNILLTSALASQGRLGSGVTAFTGNNANQFFPAGNPNVQVGDQNNRDIVKFNHYLSILANQELELGAKFNRATWSLDYARHYRDGAITVGFHIPVVLRNQKLHLKNDVSDANANILRRIQNGFYQKVDGTFAGMATQALATQQNIQFFTQFENLEDFVTKVFARKGIAFNKKETKFGMGDASGYFNLNFESAYIDRIVTGFSVLLPTAREMDTAKLWDDTLGNGGFIETALYGSFLWQHARWFNPYVHVKGTYVVGASVYRRIPRLNTWNGVTGTLNDLALGAGNPQVRDSLVFGETFNFANDVNFSEFDASVRNVADDARKVKIRPGPELFCRLGNTFDAIFSYRGFLDVYYDLHLKGKDYVKHDAAPEQFDRAILGKNSYGVSHTLGVNYSYQFDESYRLRFGGTYVVAGRNTPKSYGFDLGFNAEF